MSTTTAPASSGLAALTGKVIMGFVGTWVIALMAANLVPVLIAAMVQDLGVDIATAGALATGMTAGSALAMFVTTRFIAHADRPKLGRIGLVAMILGYGIAAALLTTPAVMGGLMLGGIGAGIMIATGTAAASSTQNPDRTVTTVMVINRVGATALLALAPLFHNDLRSVLIVITALGVLGLILAGGLPNLPGFPAQSSATSTASAHGAVTTSAPTTTERAITTTAIVLAISMCLWSLTEDMVYSMTSVLATQAGISPETSGMLLAGKVGGGLIGALLAPLALRWLGRSWSLVIIIAISTVTKFIMITSGSAVAYGTSIIVWGVMYGAILVLVTGLAAVMDVTGRVGVIVSGFYLAGVAFGPLIGGQLVGTLSPLQYALVVTAPSVVFGAALFIISRSRRKFEDGNTTAVAVAQSPAPAAARD
ncbi:MFS transporter [Leucobacter luti]|uniref:MFS transporter n=1 Tax=Leucobacter luti TaxID=340320 RepID=UPI0010EFAB76|nr:MFS transporter [Leucobacter luti]MCW2289693.1 putative MFS family arabinose efflux permease [Leucobacter luti]TCK37863.1 putative MFS family arabinose efflux permease [Leucobacter luti]